MDCFASDKMFQEKIIGNFYISLIYATLYIKNRFFIKQNHKKKQCFVIHLEHLLRFGDDIMTYFPRHPISKEQVILV